MELNITKPILLLGEANFSFTISLINYCEPKLITTTCYETKQNLSKYDPQLIETNLNELNRYQITPLFGVDACSLETYFTNRKFDRVIFMFPHVSGRSNLKKNRLLMSNFFRSVKHVLIDEDSSVYVTLAAGQGGTCFELDPSKRSNKDSWIINELAQANGFILTDCYEFKPDKFEYYRSTGFRNRHKSFRTQSGLVHKFQLSCQRIDFSLEHPVNLIEKHLSEYFKTEIKCQFVQEDLNLSLKQLWELYEIPRVRYEIDFDGLVQLGFDTKFNVTNYLKELFDLEDVRLVHSNDPRVLKESDKNSEPFKLKYRIQKLSLDTLKWNHDIGFWYDEAKFDVNLFIEIVRSHTDLIRMVKLIDVFDSGDKKALCFRLVYESCDRALDWDTTTKIQNELRKVLSDNLNGVISLR